MTECRQTGYKRIPGADHDKPAHHYVMQPGQALKIDHEGVYQPVKVDAAACAKAKQTFISGYYHGATVAEFALGSEIYAQLLPGEKTTKDKAQARRGKAEKSLAAQVREERKEQIKTPPPEPAPPKPKPTQKTKPPPEQPPVKAKKPRQRGNFELL